jgi:PAS domain S-box-containing protein
MPSAKVLGRLLIMQNILVGLPDEKSIVGFVCRGLTDIPGVAQVRYADTPQENLDPSKTRFPFLIGKSYRGELLLTVTDQTAFGPYVTYLNNFCSMVAVILEERQQRHQIEDHKVQLEQRVRERTQQLTAEIDERRSIEESLRESEERFRALVEQAPEAIVVFEVDENRFVQANANAERLFGCSREELLKSGPERFYSSLQPDNLPITESIKANIDHTLAGEKMVFERAIRNAEGKDLICEVRLIRLPSANHRLIRNSYIDITERKQAEEALRALHERYEAILTAIPDIIAEVDDNKVYTWVNPTGFDFFGEDVLGKDAAYYFEGQQETYSIVEPMFGGDSQVFYVESWQRRRDGEKRLLAWWCRGLRDENGKIIGAISTGRDITDSKGAEEEVRRLNAELEQRVRERTALLEAANKELEGFSYSVSHDLRAPLRHLTGFVNLLNQHTSEGLDEKSLHYLEVISDSAVKMGRLIDDILSFSRMGRAEMMTSSINMDTLVKEAMDTVQQDLEGRDIDWMIHSLPEVIGDPAMLKTVMINLITNAVKFTSHKPQAVIEIGYLTDQTDEEIFFIKDNGCGFDVRYQDKLFELFQRLHRAEEFPGTGLGLANCRRIITRHAGRTWAEGAVNQGATFYFSLPKRKDRIKY